MNNARTADFAATAPWDGITRKPSSFPPSAHASSHTAGGSDPVTLTMAQVLGLIEALAGKVSATITINGQPLTGPIVITKGSLGLGQVDDLSFAEMNVLPAILLNKTLVAPILHDPVSDGGTFDRVLRLGLSDGSGVSDLQIQPVGPLTSDRVLFLDPHDADRLVSLQGNLLLGADLTTAGVVSIGADFTTTDVVQILAAFTAAGAVSLAAAFTAAGVVNLTGAFGTAGGFDLLLTLTAATSVTLPTSGTLATTAEVNTAKTDAITAAAAAAAALYQPLTGNTFSVATLPSAAANVGRIVYCTDGNAGSSCGALSDGSAWKVVALGATVSP